MDLSYELSDSVKVTIRKKDQYCYVESSSETNRYFMSSVVWLKTDWVSKLDHCLDTNMCVRYRKFAVRKPNGQIIFLNKHILQLCFAISTMEWYKLQDLYASISHVL